MSRENWKRWAAGSLAGGLIAVSIASPAMARQTHGFSGTAGAWGGGFDTTKQWRTAFGPAQVDGNSDKESGFYASLYQAGQITSLVQTIYNGNRTDYNTSASTGVEVYTRIQNWNLSSQPVTVTGDWSPCLA